MSAHLRNNWTLSGNIVDVLGERIFPGVIEIMDGRIARVTPDGGSYETFLMPGFIDAHIHIESTLLVPTEFARLAVCQGTVATVSDPHEIGNVMGIAGVEYMIECGRKTNFKFFFGAPSCVPATRFETAGAEIDAKQIEKLLARDEIRYLAEMMDFPGVLSGNPAVLAKISAARKFGKPVDGHAPGLRGSEAKRYAAAGISTDHECSSREEALDKLACGMRILIREGSAARNFEALYTLINDYPKQCMFCTDDKHPDELLSGHINEFVRRAVAGGVDTMKALRAACVNPILHYGLDVGLLRPGDPADLIEVGNLTEFRHLRTVIQGQIVSEESRSMLPRLPVEIVNNFHAAPKKSMDFRVEAHGREIRVIDVQEGQLLTGSVVLPALIENGQAISDTSRDILKIVVVNRYESAPPAVGFIRGFGLKHGAIASSVAHDSHNIVAVGVTDDDLCRAINTVIAEKGGLCVASGKETLTLPLPVAGLMSDSDAYEVAHTYAMLISWVKALGTSLAAPFMTLSFMALLVIPALKMSDRGLFDSDRFQPIELFCEDNAKGKGEIWQ